MRDFIRIARFGSGVALGFIVASLYSLQAAEGGLSFEFSIGVLPAFLAGMAAAWVYWSLASRLILPADGRADPASARRKFIGFGLVMAVGTLAAFLYPLRFVPREKLPDILQGLVMAALVLGGIGWVILRIKRFFDADAELTERAEQEEREEET